MLVKFKNEKKTNNKTLQYSRQLILNTSVAETDSNFRGLFYLIQYKNRRTAEMET